MTRLDYRIASTVLRALGWLFGLLPPRRDTVVLASPRKRALDGNLLAIRDEIRARRPGIRIVELAETYGYGLRGKLAYAVRMFRAMYHLRTAPLVVVDNAWLPVHVSPHPPRTTVVQVWHAVGALKRFGVDTVPPPQEPERWFLHRHYDWVVSSGEASREPWSRAFRTPLDRVLALGSPRTDMLVDADALAAARERVLRRHPVLRDRRVITYAPTFRGRGRGKRPPPGLDAPRLRAALEASDALVLKSHPNLDARLVDTGGFDVVVDPADDMNDVLAATDILITDYSSSIFEYALLRRPLVLLVPDLEEYAKEPGMYLRYATDMIGAQVADTDAVVAAIRGGSFDLAAYEPFIARHLGAADGRATERFVKRFLPAPGRREASPAD
ncbi:MAG TPA: CDP-glycerol glycerophosphotransferase family protein [Candidatus Limnocylindrales bacterium]|nr:CDP-glycerol glycerophosphotransferase family protein [Candidatus Limnocylindrales bacterium]